VTLATALLEVVAALFVLVGVTFMLGGTVGLVRLPDVFARAHAASKCDSAGAGSVLLGLALHGGLAFDDLKLVLLAVLAVVSGPATAHALARAAHRAGRTAWTREGGGEA
jgi:multicomponent Na+:H+ antiporter subunit G